MLAIRGYGPSEIARRLGFRRESSARAALSAAVRQMPPTLAVDAMRKIATARLDALLRALWPKMKDGDRVNLAVIDRILAVEARRAQLLGLNAPRGLDLSGAMSVRDAKDADAKIDAALAAAAEEGQAVRRG